MSTEPQPRIPVCADCGLEPEPGPRLPPVCYWCHELRILRADLASREIPAEECAMSHSAAAALALLMVIALAALAAACLWLAAGGPVAQIAFLALMVVVPFAWVFCRPPEESTATATKRKD